MNIVIVDYGMGNIRSIMSTLKYLGITEVNLTAEYKLLKAADKIILPGVGSFRKAMDQIKQKNLDTFLQELVIEHKKPLLGICLGMQLLGMSSSEDGDNKGLQFVNGKVLRFEDSALKIPHVGFNQVEVNANSMLYMGLAEKPNFYFTHSYRMVSHQDINQSTCDYGDKFIASFEQNNVAGVQFHPELSQKNGLQLLKNFIEKF
jgi:glutamine amidotransferase